MKNILFFILVCGLDGISIFLGSVLGHFVGNIGLFIGAIVGGILGVGAAIWLAARFRLLDSADYRTTFLGEVIGFIVAAIIAVNNLHGPLIPVASVSFVGIGAILGKRLSSGRRVI